MAVRHLDGTNDRILCNLGSGAVGAMTYAAFIKRGADNAWHHVMGLHTTAGAQNVTALEISGGNNRLNYNVDSGSGGVESPITVTVSDGWVVVAVTKATGTATPRFHKVVPGGSAEHEDAFGTAVNAARTPACWSIGEWEGTDDFNGRIAVVAAWNSVLTNGQIEALAGSEQAWIDADPDTLLLLDQASTATPVVDLTGGGADETALTGTSVIDGDDPPGFGSAPIRLAVETSPWVNSAVFTHTLDAVARVDDVLYVAHYTQGSGGANMLEPTSPAGTWNLLGTASEVGWAPAIKLWSIKLTSGNIDGGHPTITIPQNGASSHRADILLARNASETPEDVQVSTGDSTSGHVTPAADADTVGAIVWRQVVTRGGDTGTYDWPTSAEKTDSATGSGSGGGVASSATRTSSATGSQGTETVTGSAVTAWGENAAATLTIGSATADTQAAAGNAAATGTAYQATVSTNQIHKAGDRGSAQNLTSETSTLVDLPSGSQIAVGSFLVARVAADNAGTNGAAVTLTVTDPRSHTWTILGPANADPGAANAGATCWIAYTQVVTAYSDGDDLTVGYSGVSVPAKAIVVEEWRNIGGVAVAATTATGASGTPSISRTPTAALQLLYTAMAVEGPAGDTYTQDSDTTDGSWATNTSLSTASGTAASNQTIRGAYKIVSGTGAQTWNPTITSRDWAAVAVVFALAVHAPAGAAAGSGTAYDATVSTAGGVSPNAGTATGTGVAHGAAASVAANAGHAAGTGVAHAASTSVAAGAGAASATGVAHFEPGTSISVTLIADSPVEATGTAYDATVSTAVDVETNAGAATAAGVAHGPSTSVAAGAGTVTGTGVAHGAAASVAANAGHAAGTGVAHAASTPVATGASTATGTGVAHGAAASVSAGPGTATAAGVAHGPSTSVATNTGAATGTGVAHFEPGTSISLTLIADSPVEATGTAYDATVSSSAVVHADAGHATGTGVAHAASTSVAATAGFAAGSGAAQDATATSAPTVGAAAEPAGAVGAAHGATVHAAVGAGPAGATGAAYGATVSAGAVVEVEAQHAGAVGTSGPATVAVAVLAGVAAGTGAAAAPAQRGAVRAYPHRITNTTEVAAVRRTV